MGRMQALRSPRQPSALPLLVLAITSNARAVPCHCPPWCHAQVVGRLLFKQPLLLPVLLDGNSDGEARWVLSRRARGARGLPARGFASLNAASLLQCAVVWPGRPKVVQAHTCSPLPLPSRAVGCRAGGWAVLWAVPVHPHATHAATLLMLPPPPRLLDRWVILGGARDIVEMFMPALGTLGRCAAPAVPNRSVGAPPCGALPDLALM